MITWWFIFLDQFNIRVVLNLGINCLVRLDFDRLPDYTAQSPRGLEGLYVIPPPAKKMYYTAETQRARRKKIKIFFRIF